MNERRLVTLIAIVGALFIAAVYLPDLGRGFVKDDFRWLADARAALSDPLRAIHPSVADFYRPAVTASFAVDTALFGLNARAYGFTNLFLCLACAFVIARLFRSAGVSKFAAAVAVFAWLLNPHGINMALVWISGRTSLLLTLFAVVSALALLRGHRWIASAALLCALLSKEEATLVPIILALWVVTLRRDDPRIHLADATALLAPAVMYFALRMTTPALTFANAPWFYRPTFDARTVLLNAVAYLDRGASVFAIVTAIACAVYGVAGLRVISRRALTAGAGWFVIGYALTVWLPVRSSLYAVFPSVGSALVCAAAIDALRHARQDGAIRDARLVAVLSLCLLLVPVYMRRNGRWVEPARLSARFVRALNNAPPAATPPGIIVLEDEREPYATFEHALGDLATVAVRVIAGGAHEAHIVRPGQQWPGPTVARYRLTHGKVERVN